MSIYLNNQGLKKVKAVAANINNSLKTIKGVYINVNGTIHKVWPYYAFDNGTFKGELQGGIINAPRNLHLYMDTATDTYRWPNNANWGGATDMGQTITSGALTATKDGPFGTDEKYGPFFVSVGAIDFTKYSKVRIAGSFTASMRAYRSRGDAFMDVKISLSEYVKSGNYYNRKGYTDWQHTTDITTKSTSWYTGTVNYNFTFDISSWNETSGIFCLFVNNNWYDVNHVTGGEYGSQTITINEIEFS